MPKLHMRLSVEIEVTEEQFRKVMEIAEWKPNMEPYELDIRRLPEDIDLSKATPCDWDEGGYIPGSWLNYDIADSGLVPADDVMEV